MTDYGKAREVIKDIIQAKNRRLDNTQPKAITAMKQEQIDALSTALSALTALEKAGKEVEVEKLSYIIENNGDIDEALVRNYDYEDRKEVYLKVAEQLKSHFTEILAGKKL